MSEKIYRVQMNSKGMPNFSTAKEVPSADRPQGQWIHDYHFGLALPEHKCSVCGEWEYSDTESNYCPCCGARMKGADDER